VNDRPYAASSLLAVALKDVFRTALTGRCDARPELAATPVPIEVRVPALRCADDRSGTGGAGGAELAERVFGPLGWSVSAPAVPLDPPEWGASPYLDLRLSGTVRLADALNHLYVLLPVLDDAKHYWVSTDEVDKLVRAGAGWLAGHQERALITRRYLAHQRDLTASALARLAEADDLDPDEVDNAVPDEAASGEAAPAPSLAARRREAVLAVLRESGARTVGDFGCGDGALTAALLADTAFDRVVAMDVSARALRQAARRLRPDRMPEARHDRLRLIQSALTYRDERLAGLDAAVLMEVIEHVDPERLAAVERAVFGFAAPGTIVVTTPNAEHNAEYGLPEGALRHPDHRFEWTRVEFGSWARRVAAAYGYDVRFRPVGAESPAGAPTQMAVFTRAEVAA
jgi:3' terminal RNA ribose 2'-O-methyltransferase Hen1